MPRFRKKPVEIDAFQWTGNWKPLDAWLVSMGYASWETADDDGPALWLDENDPSVLVIGTLEGDMRAPVGWWIIRGVKGEFYPCKPDIFEATYEPVDETCSLLHPHSGPCTHVEFIAKEVQ